MTPQEFALGIPCRARDDRAEKKLSQHDHGGTIYCLANFLRQNRTLNFHGSGAGEIPVPDQVSAHPLEVGQAAVVAEQVLPQSIGEFLVGFEANNNYQRFTPKTLGGPNIVGSKDTKFLDRNAFESVFDIFG